MKDFGFSEEVLEEIERSCLWNSNNCGGCETCSQVFGGREISYDFQETFMLLQMIKSRNSRIIELEKLLGEKK